MKTVTTTEFTAAVKETKGLVLVDFYAPWCGPCQGMVPVLEEVSATLPAGQAIVKVDVDESPELAAEFGVMSIPAFKMFKDGVMVEETVGGMAKEAVLELFAKHA